MGEAACWDLHGFNRLGGNSLAETVVAGMIIGKKMTEYTLGASMEYSERTVQEHVARQKERVAKLISGGGRENAYELRREMEETLMAKVGIFRKGPDLQEAVNKLQELYNRSLNIGLRSSGMWANPELSLALRVPGMLKLALCISYGALTRTESRGSHFREDFPKDRKSVV